VAANYLAPACGTKSFDDVVREHEAHVYRVCLRLLGEDHAAWDAAQETFLAAWRNNWNSERLDSIGAWLACIAVNKSIDELRRRARRGHSLEASMAKGAPEPADGERHADFRALNTELCCELNAALLKLPYALRLAVVLHDVEGLTYPQIARVSGVPVGTVRSRLHRARLQLQRLLSRSQKGELPRLDAVAASG
jgi:RNA polymerase sigma-70 factor (ECF subfamily)